MEQKECSGCKITQPISEFGRDPRVPSGLQSRCRTCDGKSKLSKYQGMTPKKKRAFLKAISIRGKRSQDRKRRLSICRNCSAKALPGLRQCAYHRKAHRQAQSFRVVRARADGLCVTCCVRPMASGTKHCQVCLDRRRTYWLNLRKDVQAAYGGRCQCCGETGSLFLSIDHIENDGCDHRRLLKTPGRGGQTFYLWLKHQGFPKKEFQLLCMTCNWGKRMNKGVCPHVSDPIGHPLPLRQV